MKHIFLFLLLFFIHVLVRAQLTADFEMSSSAGCSPLPVTFTNKTKGASQAAVYNWDFGNGNTSTLFSPGAVYRNEQTYTVTLRVKDGALTSSVSKTLTVYKKPVVDFTSPVSKGCFPLAVAFSSNASPGDGTIKEYFWDFGDGTTAQGGNLAQQNHTYTFAQTASVNLTVTNSFGCYTTVLKEGIVKVSHPVKVSFDAGQTILCRVGDSVGFTNASTGAGTLSYEWDFGDGTTSAESVPRHQYNQPGKYSVKLKVTSSEGCSSEAEKTDLIQVGGFQSGFDVQDLVCDGNTARFTQTTTPVADNSVWDFGDGGQGSSGTGVVSHTYQEPGTYTVRLTNKFGSCTDTVTRQVVVKKGIRSAGFLSEFNGSCGAPVTVSFRDTTAAAVSWLWKFSGTDSAATREAAYTYAANGVYNVSLRIANDEGCTAELKKQVTVAKPAVTIKASNVSGGTGNSGCTGLHLRFEATGNADITAYNWHFGDGSTSIEEKPEYQYNASGKYAVTLYYTTGNGCQDSVRYEGVSVFNRPQIDFRTDSTTICGNSPVDFTGVSNTAVDTWRWWFGDGTAPVTGTGATTRYKYLKEGTYTVTLVASNNGCNDTLTKENFIQVLPPFTRIANALNTCRDDRTTVTFRQTSQKAETLTWDFGDGSTQQSTRTQIEHAYAATGTYNVVLTATNGQCAVQDSVRVFVLKKPTIELTTDKGELCASDSLSITVSGMEANPNTIFKGGRNHYRIAALQYADGSLFKGTNTYTGSRNGWSEVYTGRLSNFDSEKEQLRVILRSEYFGCTDTANYVPLKINGPKAAFVADSIGCLDKPVIFKDASRGGIESWEWDFDDGTTETHTTSSTIRHVYSKPGNYVVTLKVTDRDGCFSFVRDSASQIYISGPKAQFVVSDTAVLPQTKVSFTNTSLMAGQDSGNVRFTWLIDNRVHSSSFHAEKLFTRLGAEKVQLIALNKATRCADTAEQTIRIKRLIAAYTYTTTYLNSNSCPPMVAKFKNASENYKRTLWVFGDGSTSENEETPSHTYTSAGEYRVVLYIYGNNGQVDSSVQSIRVKGPSADLKADVLWGCVGQKVRLSAMVKNADSFTWDFGDGTLLESTDTFSVHQYLTGGLYTPSLILKDSTGCISTSDLAQQVIIDSLNLSIRKPALHLCDSALVAFEPAVSSIAVDSLQKSLLYQWNFGTGNSRDTAQTATASFHYRQKGTYVVRLKAASPYGCVAEASDTVVVHQTVKGGITGPVDVCVGTTAQFTALPRTQDGLAKEWIFSDGTLPDSGNPISKTFADSGLHQVRLVVTHDGCTDTTVTNVAVHGGPDIQLASRNERICLDNPVQLSASGGTAYTWSPAVRLSNPRVAAPVATPQTTTTYTVSVTDNWGCSNKDSVLVEVVQPLKLQLVSDTFVCIGSSVQLRAAGAAAYQWMEAGNTLSNTQIADPFAAPVQNTLYTLVGSDAYQCFTDTARVLVEVKSLPSVSAGTDAELITGTPYQIRAQGSADVTRWKWSPEEYLSCTTCPQPVAKPLKPMQYSVEVQNRFGCKAVDSVSINVLCNDGYVFIPNAFTPNRDGRNETFSPQGRGVRRIKSFRIFDRWGTLVFEHRNFAIGDLAGAWDGTSNGKPAAAGTFVYVAEMECAEGSLFVHRGTVTLIR